MKHNYQKKLYITLILAAMVSLPFGALAQSNYVLKTGDTMTGPLSIEAQGTNTPAAIELFGTSDTYKFLRFNNTTDGAVWDISMATVDNTLEFYFSPDGTNIWTIPFSIDANGVLYGNAYGLTNLNVVAAIPENAITADKVSNEIVTFDVFSSDSIDSLEIGGTVGLRKNTTGSECLTVGARNIASNKSVAAGWSSTASGNSSFAAGGFTVASGENSQAMGYNTKASGIYSHAEGSFTIASNYAAHAEGYDTRAYGQMSHAEGNRTIAAGSSSHAEGFLSEANGSASHAGGERAIADHDNAYVWSSSDDSSAAFSSTTNRQFNVYADNGIRLVAGSNATVEVVGLDLSDIGCYGDIPMFGE